MMFGKTVLVYLILCFPTITESVIIDPWFWKRKKSDKPTSTQIRAFFFIMLPIVIDLILNYSHWYYAMGVMLFVHVTFFAPLVNIKLKQDIDYLGTDRYDQFIKKIPFAVRFFTALGLLALFVYLFEHSKY